MMYVFLQMGTVDGNTSHQSRNETSFSWTNVMERKPKSPVVVDTPQTTVSGNICVIILISSASCHLIFSEQPTITCYFVEIEKCV